MLELDSWSNLWQRAKARGDGVREFWELARRYSEPHRRYHTFSHISQGLVELNDVNPSVKVEFAWWYHDSIYDTAKSNNEEQSGLLAHNTLVSAGLGNELAESVYTLILATKHTVFPRNLDEQILTDVDLSILGSPQREFDLYEKQIREEYSWVPEDKFKEGRAKILHQFLARPQIYSTTHFKEKYEMRARANLMRALTQLA